MHTCNPYCKVRSAASPPALPSQALLAGFEGLEPGQLELGHGSQLLIEGEVAEQRPCRCQRHDPAAPLAASPAVAATAPSAAPSPLSFPSPHILGFALGSLAALAGAVSPVHVCVASSGMSMPTTPTTVTITDTVTVTIMAAPPRPCIPALATRLLPLLPLSVIGMSDTTVAGVVASMAGMLGHVRATELCQLSAAAAADSTDVVGRGVCVGEGQRQGRVVDEAREDSGTSSSFLGHRCSCSCCCCRCGRGRRRRSSG